MATRDRRPESQPERNTADEKSRKATDPNVFDDQAQEGQTPGSETRGPDPGQYTDRGSPGYQGR